MTDSTRKIAKEITMMRSEEYWREIVKTGKDPLVRMIEKALDAEHQKGFEEGISRLEKENEELRIKLNCPPFKVCPKCKSKKLKGYGPFDIQCRKCKLIMGYARPIPIMIENLIK